jgi:hypothetical protein
MKFFFITYSDNYAKAFDRSDFTNKNLGSPAPLLLSATGMLNFTIRKIRTESFKFEKNNGVTSWKEYWRRHPDSNQETVLILLKIFYTMTNFGQTFYAVTHKN